MDRVHSAAMKRQTGCAGLLAGIRRKAPLWLSHAALVPVFLAVSLHAQSGVPEGYELVYSQDFGDASALDDFTFSDRRAWKHGSERGRGYLDLEGGSKYKPKHRSPLNIALIDDLLLADFVLEVEAWQTGREYGHRDLSLFFGFEGPNRYYYAHLATEPDDRAHNIFLVDNADRAPMGAIPDEGVDWGSGWKRVRVERQDGSLRVYFDSERQPTVSTDRDPLGWGRVGFGSFDDTGRFSQIRIWAPETKKAVSPPFD
ncbi:MAG: hypothetical protein OXG74_16650 [Acidobacteria bacterium]|nr:hypothetical protein [Acidobacteriota bacterium]